MYSTPGGGRPTAGGGGAKGGRVQGRYIKGRLPEGVDFAAYPGRSSTPLPTAESKSAERINQLKIWNEAATGVNQDKRMTPRSKDERNAPERRTDSFKEARERHSASFNAAPTRRIPAAASQPPADIYADRSDDEYDEDDDEEAAAAAAPVPAAAPARQAPPPAAAAAPPVDMPRYNGHAHVPVQPAGSAPAQHIGNGAHMRPPEVHAPGGESTHASQSAPQAKTSAGCCVLV